MKQIDAKVITQEVKRLVMEANYFLPDDVLKTLKDAQENEKWELASQVIGKIVENAEIAKEDAVPMCQDTGMAVLFVEIGQDVHVTGGGLTQAINEGVRRGYKEGYLRKSVVKDPIERVNTGDNTPAVIHYDIVDGDKIKIMVAPKGFGSENMSGLKMLKPSDGIEGIKQFVITLMQVCTRLFDLKVIKIQARNTYMQISIKGV